MSILLQQKYFLDETEQFLFSQEASNGNSIRLDISFLQKSFADFQREIFEDFAAQLTDSLSETIEVYEAKKSVEELLQAVNKKLLLL